MIIFVSQDSVVVSTYKTSTYAENRALRCSHCEKNWLGNLRNICSKSRLLLHRVQGMADGARLQLTSRGMTIVIY